ncbi:MAG TPA: CofH family radical SAM protein, partial [Elusimicrobiota bacterium]|nr:CofH family radical SAM protein [Elusimicrobiota bacterium]
LRSLGNKVESGTRLSLDDGRRLFASDDLLGIGRLADHVRRKRHRDRTTFVVNRQINPTNICSLSCRFCCFSVKDGAPGAYVLGIRDILSRLSPDLREVHIVGGLYEGWDFEDYLNIVREVHRAAPAVSIKAYTAVEIDFFARREKTTAGEILRRLKEAGVVCLPGGGAEVFSERVRKILFPRKIGRDRWLDIHRTAHRMGLRSNATLLYGHIETVEERLDHLMKLRSLQDDTGGFLSFIPLPFQPGDSGLVDRPASAMDDLKTVAVSRLLLDNFDHIKSYWVAVGEDLCSVALHFGADDVDGTIREERVMHAARARTPEGLTRDRIVRLVREAGFVPVERDGLYRNRREVRGGRSA